MPQKQFFLSPIHHIFSKAVQFKERAFFSLGVRPKGEEKCDKNIKSQGWKIKEIFVSFLPADSKLQEKATSKTGLWCNLVYSGLCAHGLRRWPYELCFLLYIWERRLFPSKLQSSLFCANLDKESPGPQTQNKPKKR